MPKLNPKRPPKIDRCTTTKYRDKTEYAFVFSNDIKDWIGFGYKKRLREKIWRAKA